MKIYLVLGIFFLPIGYDFIFYLVIQLVGSYWIADLIFYALSGIFFSLYFYGSRKNSKSIRYYYDKYKTILRQRKG